MDSNRQNVLAGTADVAGSPKEYITWEQAVSWLREQPDQHHLVQACYYDDPLLQSAERFSQGEEAAELQKWVAPHLPGSVLDLGAGRGIASYLFARMSGEVTALEPDPSSLVGAGAIEQLAEAAGLHITVVKEFGERLPFVDGSFNVVYARAVLHHARDLPQLCREVARVLKSGGVFVATREHVISTKEDLPEFLKNHPLHKLYGGENAFLLSEYTGALQAAGLSLDASLGPFDSAINYFPTTREEFRAVVEKRLGNKIPALLARWFARFGLVQRLIGKRLSRQSNDAGRLYSFLARKP